MDVSSVDSHFVSFVFKSQLSFFFLQNYVYDSFACFQKTNKVLLNDPCNNMASRICMNDIPSFGTATPIA